MGDRRLLWGIALMSVAAWLAALLTVVVSTPLADRVPWLPTPLGVGSCLAGVTGVASLIAAASRP